MKSAKKAGDDIGLSAEELAFYDALSSPEDVKEASSNDEFIAMTHELTDMIRNNKTIDWQKKESARANMRRMIKRLLKKHKYPLEGQDKALEMIISQVSYFVDEV